MVGPAIGGVAFASSRGAAQSYDRTVDIVEAGADDSGSTPIDDVLDSVVEDDTLVEFPPGTYRMEREHVYNNARNVGLVGTEGSGQTRLVVDGSFRDENLFDFGTSGSRASTNVTVRGFTFDQTASGAGAMFFWAYVNDGCEIEDITVEGAVEGPRPSGKGEILVRVDVTNSDGNATIRELRATDGAIDAGSGDPAGPGIYIGGAHAGSVLIEECEIAGFHDNGVYTSDAETGGGDVVIRGGRYANNDVSNVRVGGKNTLVEGVTIVQDSVEGMPYNNPRGIYARNGNATIRDVDIVYKKGNSEAIQYRHTMGHLELENVRIRQETDETTVRLADGASFTADQLRIVATNDGNPILTGSNGTAEITNSCIQASEGNRDGLLFSSVDAHVADSTVNVTGTTVDGATTQNISTDGTCSLSDGQNGSDGSEEPDTSENTLEILTSEGGDTIDYEFIADGRVDHVTDAGRNSGEANNDAITDNGDGTYTVTGRTGNGYGDSFTVAGELREFQTAADSSAYTLRWNGEAINVDESGVPNDDTSSDEGSDDGSNDDGSSGDDGAGDDISYDKVLVIDGTDDAEGTARYTFTVSGDVVRDDEYSEVRADGIAWDNLTDAVDGNRVVGVVGNGVDAYGFTGSLTDIDIRGKATFTIVRN